MIIRTDTDYAIRALLELGQAPGKPLSCTAIAERCSIPKSFAHKILKKLVKAGIVKSHSGRFGGFALHNGSIDVSLLSITQAIQGPVSVRQCILHPDLCSRSKCCALSAQWRKLQNSVGEFLDRISLRDVMATADLPAKGRR